MEGEVVVRRVRPGEVAAVRELRLRALRDSPEAFESTFERENAFPNDVWVERVERGANAPDSATFVAELGETLVGMAGAHLEADGAVAYLFGVWVAPEARRRGVGARLTTAVASWARSTGAGRLRLWVAAANEPAVRLYEHLGFAPTGTQKPMAGSGRLEVEMASPLR